MSAAIPFPTNSCPVMIRKLAQFSGNDSNLSRNIFDRLDCSSLGASPAQTSGRKLETELKNHSIPTATCTRSYQCYTGIETTGCHDTKRKGFFANPMKFNPSAASAIRQPADYQFPPWRSLLKANVGAIREACSPQTTHAQKANVVVDVALPRPPL